MSKKHLCDACGQDIGWPYYKILIPKRWFEGNYYPYAGRRFEFCSRCAEGVVERVKAALKVEK